MQCHSVCSLLGFSGRFCKYRKPNFPAVSGSYLPGFSGHICSYWQPNFPAVSSSYLPGFSGRICSYWQPNFPTVSVVTFRDFPAVTFRRGNLKKTLWAAGKLFWYLQREFLSLMREFFGGKLKQKGFFHSAPASIQIVGGGGGALPASPLPLNTCSHNTATRRPPHPSNTQQQTTTFLWDNNFLKQRDIGIFMYPSAVVYCCCLLLSVVRCSCVLLCVVAC